jgi:hypothetical protein
MPLHRLYEWFPLQGKGEKCRKKTMTKMNSALPFHRPFRRHRRRHRHH